MPSFAGFSTVDLQRMLRGMQLDRGGKLKIPQLMLRKDLQQRLALEGIKQAGLEMREEGLFVEINGKQLPHLAWDEDRLSNLSSPVSYTHLDVYKRQPYTHSTNWHSFCIKPLICRQNNN